MPSILTPDLGLLFWMLLAFLVVFFVLAKFGFPAITVMVEKRKNYIDESLKKAHEASLKLENIKQESEAILQEAREKQASSRRPHPHVMLLWRKLRVKHERRVRASSARPKPRLKRISRPPSAISASK